MALQNYGGIWTAAFVFLFIQSAVCKIINSDEPASHVSDDYGTELNPIETDIRPGSQSVEYDEKGIWICPETFQLTFDLEHKPFSIHLVRSPGTRSTKLPIFLSDGQKIWLHERKITRQYCNYQDIYTSSSFTITLEDSRYILDGTFRKTGKLFGIRPKEFSGRRVKRSMHDTRQHFLFLLSDNHENFSETKVDFSSRAKRDAKTRYEVEVLVVLDYSVYERFQTFGEDDETTEEKLAYHFSHVLNEVNLRFAGIDDQDYEIRIMMAGLLAAKTAFGSPWTKESVEKPTSAAVLKNFTYYLNEILPKIVKLPNFDHAMLFVQYDIYLRTGNRLSSGSQYRDSICQYNRTTLVKNMNMFHTIFTATRGLAMNLGANYDGTGNFCSSIKMFQMTPLLSSTRISEYYWNVYKFSSCSKWDLRIKLDKMTRSNTCLINTTVWDDTVMKSHLATPPGQVYSLDHQCQELEGPDSYFCGSQQNADQVCSRILCWLPRTAACWQYNDMLANEGTTCGDRKWCVKGKCLHDSNAPSVDPNCIFGDTPQTVFGVTCIQAIEAYPYLCYNSTYRDFCCASCASIYQPDEVGCEYGDREEACQSASHLFCTARSGDYCCKSCRNFRQPFVAIFSNDQQNNTNVNDNEEGVTTTSETTVSTASPEISTPMDAECGGSLTALPIAQSFASPGYPIGYTSNQLCDWLIQSEPGYRIWLNITDMDLEPAYNCHFDYVGLYSSGYPSVYSRKKVCRKSSVGYNITSTGNRLLVRFHSDEQVTKKGFAAEYKAVCGGLIKDDEGTVMSPGYPTRYIANTNCTWTIKVDIGRVINATFHTFSLPGTNGHCGEDKVELFDGSSSSSQLTGSPFCGTDLPGPFETTSRYLTVVFTASSNPPSGHTGFSLTFKEQSVSCGQQITLNNITDEGYLASPNYPDRYPAFSDCVWVITSPTNTIIQLEFDPYFTTERFFNYCFDYVDVRDGSTSSSNRIGRYCGRTSPGIVLSSGNIIYVRFKANGSTSYQGFRLKYSVTVAVTVSDDPRLTSPIMTPVTTAPK